ncbi:MAG: phosphoribosylaminoimidazolesuccinocarboxamide synthase [Actinobacteria bacterium]|nr:MAG: phosphoribosylaminoimidazolesuccinocarboxamide synthase [Actinomycetota bacterium]
MPLPHLYSGKVRDIFEVPGDMLLFVASDRISAFDVVMAETIPDKGRVLTAMTTYWLEDLAGVAPSHLVTADPAQLPTDAQGMTDLAGRAMLVRRAEMLPLECIVRGYLAGSGWKEYASSGTLHGSSLPPGLQESDRLPEPLFTPSTKATAGHDENITVDQAADIVGGDVVKQAAEMSLAVYRKGADLAAQRGIIIADTKFELGWIDGVLALCDEVLTPDSSRFWDADTYKPGATPPSFDKQPVRDWAEATGWDKQPPAPSLPGDVIDASRRRYVEAYERLTGLPFSQWAGVEGT